MLAVTTVVLQYNLLSLSLKLFNQNVNIVHVILIHKICHLFVVALTMTARMNFCPSHIPFGFGEPFQDYHYMGSSHLLSHPTIKQTFLLLYVYIYVRYTSFSYQYHR